MKVHVQTDAAVLIYLWLRFAFLCESCVLIQLLQLVYAAKVEDAKHLLQLQRVHQTLFIRAYTSDKVRPKHHFSMHVPLQAAREGILVDTFVHERKHRMFKSFLEKFCGKHEMPACSSLLMRMNVNMVHESDRCSKIGVCGRTSVVEEPQLL